MATSRNADVAHHKMALLDWEVLQDLEFILEVSPYDLLVVVDDTFSWVSMAGNPLAMSVHSVPYTTVPPFSSIQPHHCPHHSLHNQGCLLAVA